MSSDVANPSAHQILKAIEQAGGRLTAAQWNQIMEHPDLAATIARLIRNYGTEAVFPSYEQQCENVRRWLGERVWRFGPSALGAAQFMIPRLPDPGLDPLQATFLMPWLGVYRDTLELLWSAVLRTHPGADSEYGRHLEHVEGIDDQMEPFPKPCLQWVQIQLGANVGSPLFRAPGTGLDSGLVHDELAGLHLLAAAAHSRAWAVQLGQRFPRVALGACRWRDRSQVHSVPLLSCSVGSNLHLLKLTQIVRDWGPIAQPTIKVLGP